MASENNNVPVNEEENQKASTRNEQDTSLGPIYDTENKEAGEAEAWQHAYDASAPSFELNTDAGIADKQTERDEDEGDYNIKQ